MNSSEPTHDNFPRSHTGDGASLAESACLPYLFETQNPDGGWGFSKGSESRVEPTSWALLAIEEFAGAATDDSAITRGYRFLEGSQLADGSWPNAAGQTVGSWVTSLACWALLARGEKSEIAERGLRWLGEDTPGDAQLLRRVVRGAVGLLSKRRVNAQSESLWGWSWTEGTASWVEPTAQALIVLRMGREGTGSRDLEKRLAMAEKMLYDRMCPGGGWNCGNPMVYGVPGEPLVGPTVWAMLALRTHAERTENQQSLDWLNQNWMNIQSPGSLALADIGLGAYGRHIPEIKTALAKLYAQGGFSWSVPVIAWTALALSQKMRWITR
jgi:hypothetical protein